MIMPSVIRDLMKASLATNVEAFIGPTLPGCKPWLPYRRRLTPTVPDQAFVLATIGECSFTDEYRFSQHGSAHGEA